ncbi:hypothetical protein Glove_99g50 [Diversispora epigaea]|uniref:Uncharacterized protein n=1 Tax=Diversispora epigaea TaxID=1348612 RepID=A0A397J849_9GLOM|nr:hypothetical protein Glove_99g50 [Diversispora epigaea]
MSLQIPWLPPTPANDIRKYRKRLTPQCLSLDEQTVSPCDLNMVQLSNKLIHSSRDYQKMINKNAAID